MKLYLGASPKELKDVNEDGSLKYKFDKILISYYIFKTQYAKLKNEIERYDTFVDSGAFSAFSRKTILDVNKYIEFIKQNDIKTYAALDVIYDPKATRRNFEIMLGEGLNPIPTFHYNTDIKELRYYMQYPYIALGGLVPLAAQRKKLESWLEYCFSYLEKPIIEQGLKVHGFGVMNLELLRRYPFYSVDSTSWRISSKYGLMYKEQEAQEKPIRDTSENAEFLRQENNTIVLSQRNIDIYIEAEKFLTKLWAKRGFIFKD